MAEFLSDDSIDFAAYFAETDHKTKVKPAADFVGAAKDRLRLKVQQKSTYLPWPKCNSAFEFRRGEVTMWAGQNGHGKTDMTTQMALSLVGQGERVCVASFEMKPVVTVARMVRQFSMTSLSSPQYQSPGGMDMLCGWYDDFGQWTNGRLWLYDQTGTAQPTIVLGMVKYCAQELGITHVFIDSLMKCVRDEDDYNGQKDFIDRLCALAKDCDIHIHVVHHLKKPGKEGDLPDKHDTKGSGSITDQVDNLFMVWRNKPKEEQARIRGDLSTKRMEPDAYLLCRKQRNYEGDADGEPAISLWRERASGQFLASEEDPPQFFPSYPHLPT